MNKSIIHKIGYEIEGEFTRDLFRDMNKKRFGSFCEDSSLSFCEDGNQYQDPLLVGTNCASRMDLREFRSRPSTNLRNILNPITFLVGKEKKQYHWNLSCGFHVHVSFKKYPYALIKENFMRWWADKMKRTFPYHYNRRFGGYNPVEYDPEERHVAVNISKYVDRYFYGDIYSEDMFNRSLNPKTNTIEFRIFPATTPKTMIEFVRFTKSTIDQYVRQQTSYN